MLFSSILWRFVSKTLEHVEKDFRLSGLFRRNGYAVLFQKRE